MKSFFRVPFIIAVWCLASLAVSGQHNNPFSSNPESRGTKAPQTIAERTFKIASDATHRSLKPTEIYRVAAGDILYITLANAPNAAGYYTVRDDGTIDFPLAGDSPSVQGMSLDDIERELAAGITIFPEPIVSVKVRQYGSHKVGVTGLVAHTGDRALQREALPLFVIKADAVVDPTATTVVIRRTAMTKPETYSLGDPATDDVLVYPGNTIDFASDARPAQPTANGFFYIAGSIRNAGQHELVDGMTLMQAMLASGGTTGDAKKIFVRRKTQDGRLTVAEYEFRKIRDGKAADPCLQPGDMIEITK